jgi:FkbH-like protein
MYRTVHQTDLVKVVVVDLDDTLWKGVSGDLDEINDRLVEGWPIGFAEALMYLKKRGILLAIASKNEESRIREIWPKIFGGRVRLEDFAAVKINWQPKTENMREILEGMNLLPRNAVFIDDNPAEREAMQLAFPDMRILGRYPYYLKRILLWSSETQVAVVTQESGRRTEMIQAQFAREAQRKEMTREQFLRDAGLKLTLLGIDGTSHARFDRVFELINKTNQFNTTGRRWKPEECEEFFRTGGQMLAFEVIDRFTSYGLVGAVLFRVGHIEQWVMSCRVLGYQIEQAVMAVLVAATRAIRPGVVTGRLIHTEANFPCRELFQNCGFRQTNDPGVWELSSDIVVAIPEHVTVTQEEGDRSAR